MAGKLTVGKIRGEHTTPEKFNGRLSPAEWQKMRILWTSDPTSTFSSLGRMFGVSKQAVQRQANNPKDPWIRATTPAEMAALAMAEVDRRMQDQRMKVIPARVDLVAPGDIATAGAIAERVSRMPDVGPQEISVEPDAELLARIEEERRRLRGDAPDPEPQPVDPLVDKAPRTQAKHNLPGRHVVRPSAWSDDVQTQSEVALQTAVEIRAQVIEKHRREWAAARQLSYEAIKGRDFERAKLAKITAETIAIIQKSERLAYGLDVPPDEPKGAGGGRTIVIEREALPLPSADPESAE